MSVLERLQSVTTIVNNLANPELLKAFNVLQNEVYALDSQRRELDARVKELEDRLSFREQLVFKKNVYWHVTAAHKEEGPYCPRCFDRERSPRRMTIHDHIEVYVCPSCLFMVDWEGADVGTGVRNRFLRAFSTSRKVSTSSSRMR